MTIIHSSDLGWTAGQDISEEFVALAKTFKPGDTFVLDHMYQISAPRAINLPDDFTLAGGAPGAGFDRIDTDKHIDPMIRFGANNTVTDLTVTHSEAPNTGNQSTGTQAGVDYHSSITFSASEDGLTIRNSSFEGNVSVILNIFESDNVVIENSEFIGSLAQVRLLGGVTNTTIHNTLFDRPLGDGIKTVFGNDGGYVSNVTITDTVFLNPNRDGIDSTGGFKDATITGSYFIGGFTGLDLKTGIDSPTNFVPGTPINENILITNSEFIDNNNAVVATTLDPAGLLTPSNAKQWAVQNINIEDSIIESTDGGQRYMLLVKDSYDIHWNNVELLGNVGASRERSFFDTGLPQDINGTGVTTGPSRGELSDAYYQDLAGPDWSNIAYPTDGPVTPDEPVVEPDPISYTPPAPAPVDPDPVVEVPIKDEPVQEAPVDDTVLFRWNAGSSDVAAVDGGPDWLADASAIVGGETRVYTANSISALDPSVSQGAVPIGLFGQERWDARGGTAMSSEFGDGALDTGTYAVRLFMGNSFGGTSAEGKRVFDVSVENELFLDDVDLVKSFGHQTGGMFEWVGQVTDGTIDIDFGHEIENPLINGVEIVKLGTAAVDPDPIEEAPVADEPTQVPLPVDPDPVVEVPIKDEPVQEAPVDDTVLFRWNAGSSDVAAVDGGPDWLADASAIVGGETRVYTANSISALDPSVSQGAVPIGLFGQERWDARGGTAMSLEFGDGALDTGTYAVRLFMGNSFGGTSAEGKRVFDVSVENELFLDDVDLVKSFGHQTGGMFEWVGQVTDGTIDIDFGHEIENPLINGVEIVKLGTAAVDPDPIEDDAYLSTFSDASLIEGIA